MLPKNGMYEIALDDALDFLHMRVKEFYIGCGEAKEPSGAQALELAEKVYQDVPDDARANYLLGMLLGKMNSPERSLEFLLRATQLDPLNPDYAGDTAIALYKSGKKDIAKGYLEIAGKLEPGNGQIDYWRGIFAADEGEYETALVHLEKAVYKLERQDHLPKYVRDRAAAQQMIHLLKNEIMKQTGGGVIGSCGGIIVG